MMQSVYHSVLRPGSRSKAMIVLVCNFHFELFHIIDIKILEGSTHSIFGVHDNHGIRDDHDIRDARDNARNVCDVHSPT